MRAYVLSLLMMTVALLAAWVRGYFFLGYREHDRRRIGSS